MKKRFIRTSILNLTSFQWEKIREIETGDGIINVTPKEFIEIVGFDGGMFLSGKANKEELSFITEFYFGRENFI